MKFLRSAILATLSVLLATSQGFSQTKVQEESHEKSVQLSQVPKPARDAAQKEFGVAPTEAKLVDGTGPQEYELEAKDRSGKEMGIHVRADGTITKREAE